MQNNNQSLVTLVSRTLVELIMRDNNQSLIILVSRTLVRWRLRLMPKKSHRELFYFRFVRPSLIRVLVGSRGNTEITQGAKAKAPANPDAEKVKLRENSLMKKEDVKEILLIKCDHVGDFFLTLQAFTIIRKGFPFAKITLLCGPWNKDLALQSGLFDRVITINLVAEVSSHNAETFNSKAIEEYGLPEFDLAIDLKVETDMQFLFHYIRAKFKAGFEHGNLELPLNLLDSDEASNYRLPPRMDFIFTAPSFRNQGIPNKARHAQTLLAAFSAGIVEYFDRQEVMCHAFKPFLENRSSVRLIRRGKGPLIGINTGSGAPTRNWALAYYIDAIKCLIAQHDVTIVLLGSKHQAEDGRGIIEAVGDTNVINCIDVVSLVELPEVIHQLDLYIGHDTGGTHLAALMEQKTLCLHSGVTPLESYGPVGKNVTILKCQELSCLFCGLTSLSDCQHNHACMNLIKPAIVVSTCEEILGLTAA